MTLSIRRLKGIDVGINKFLVTSDGDEFENPRFLRKSERKLKRAQRSLSKKKRHSNNYKKQLKVVQKYHTKVANQRNDFLHKLSYKLSIENDAIIVEDLVIKNMVKNRKLA